MRRVDGFVLRTVIMDGDGSSLTAANELPGSLRDTILSYPHLQWIMATGRSLDLLKQTPICPFLTQNVPHILDGGASLMYLDGRKQVHHDLSGAELRLLFAQIRPEDINFLYFSRDGVQGFAYAEGTNAREKFGYRSEHVTFTNRLEEFAGWTFQLTPTKILLNTKGQPRLDGLSHHRNGDYIDITPQGVNKGSACAELMEALGLEVQSTAFVFNDRNDMPVLEHEALAGLITIKVGPLLPKVLSCFSVASPDEVAEIIRALAGPPTNGKK